LGFGFEIIFIAEPFIFAAFGLTSLYKKDGLAASVSPDKRTTPQMH